MSEEKIRLIVSDIDGTLIHGSQSELNPELFTLLEQLSEKGVLFAPASGRQYHSLRRLFAPAAERLCFLCENGAEVYGPCEREEDAVPLAQCEMDRASCDGIVSDILARPACSALISVSNLSLMISRHPAFVDRIANFVGNRCLVVPDMDAVTQPIIKLAAYTEEGSTVTEAAIADRWREKGFTVSVAGVQWLDFTLANKGTGLRDLCRVLDVKPEEVMAFGDNYNDTAMLDLAGHPVIMDNASEELRRRYPHHCAKVEDYLREFFGLA